MKPNEEIRDIPAILATLKTATQNKLLAEAHLRVCKHRLEEAHQETVEVTENYNDLVQELKRALELDAAMGMDDQVFEHVVKV